MADRFPLILNTSTNQIQEIPSGDHLDLTGSGIVNAGVITATSFSGNIVAGAGTSNVVAGVITATQLDLNGDIDVDGHTNLDNLSVAGVSTFTGNADFSAGVDVTGHATVSQSLTVTGTTSLGETVNITGNDPNITFVDSNNNPDFKIFGNGGTLNFVDSTSSANRLVINSDGHVDIPGNLDCGAGVDVTGNITATGNVSGVDGTFTGNVSIGGTLTYEDVTNIDSVGIVTARDGVFLPDLKQLKIGNTAAAPDLYLWHNSSTGNSNISNKTGDLYIQGNNGSGTVVNQIAVKSNAAVEINYQGNKKVETTSGGVLVTGDVDSTTGIFERTTGFTSQLKFKDSNETQLIHGSNGQVLLSFVGTGNAARGSIDAQSGFIRIKNAAGETGIICRDSSSTDLHHSGNKKLETTANGIIIYGPESGGGLVNIYADEGDDNADKWRLHANPNGSFYLQNYSQGSWHNNISGAGGGAAILYHNNVNVFETNSGGCKSSISGPNTFTIGSTDASGAYLVLDGDSNGDGTGSDYCSIQHGTDGDFSIHCDNPNGDAQFELYTGSGSTTAIVAEAAGEVQLYHNGTQKFNTSSSGCTLQGTLTAQGTGYGSGSSNLEMQPYGQRGYINWTGTENFYFRTGSSYTTRWIIDGNGHFKPGSNNTYDLGSTGLRWRNIYTADLQLSNKGKTNDVDNTWGDYTIQEGESDLFLINNRSGKKYKFNLTEVS